MATGKLETALEVLERMDRERRAEATPCLEVLEVLEAVIRAAAMTMDDNEVKTVDDNEVKAMDDEKLMVLDVRDGELVMTTLDDFLDEVTEHADEGIDLAARIHDQAMDLVAMREALEEAGVVEAYAYPYDYAEAYEHAVALFTGARR